MISTLELQQFRGLEHVKFEKLGRVNLIVGGNNLGKTSILEALVLLYGTRTQLNELPSTFRVIPCAENESSSGFWKFLVRNNKVSELLLKAGNKTLTGRGNSEDWTIDFAKSNLLELPLINVSAQTEVSIGNGNPKNEVAILSTKQADPAFVSELFNQIAPLNPDNEEKLEELLRHSIEPRLKRLRYARPEGTQTHLVYVDLGEGKMIPFTQMGQAFARTLQVYCEIFAQRPKILLIDEIENGLYYEGMEDYWKGLMAVLEDQDVQLFATTHSRECMEAAYRAAKDIPSNPLRYLRLDRRIDDPAKIVATTFGKEEMATAIEFNLEMR